VVSNAVIYKRNIFFMVLFTFSQDFLVRSSHLGVCGERGEYLFLLPLLLTLYSCEQPECI
jgi:hypothetical protein